MISEITLYRIMNIEKIFAETRRLAEGFRSLTENGAKQRWRSLKLRNAESDEYYIVFDKEKPY